MTLAELAARLGIEERRAEAVLRPLLEAGLVVIEGGGYRVADPLVEFAFA